MKVVILGSGRQGARLALLLEAENYDVSIIDKISDSFKRLEHFKGEKILGNGIDIDTLKKAGIEKAYAFAAVTNGDNTNLMTAQIAKTIFKVPKVVCRVYDPRRAGIYHDLGLDTVCSTTVGARMLRNIISTPKILRQYQIGDGTALAIEIKLGKASEGKKIKEIEIKGEFRISAVIRDHIPYVPYPDFELKAGDQIFGVIKTEGLEISKKILEIEDYAVNYPLKGGY
ncbi:MAG: NAD-binding protein [Armatimonadetes bacterium]|nr:NAD-binding protein [Armatimonadota bacterium]